MIDWQGFLKRRSKGCRVERRAAVRARTRLRPGKIVSPDHRFLADCAIIDRSRSGLRLRAFGEIESNDGVLAVFDENEGLVRYGRIAWRSQGEIGLQLDGEATLPDKEACRRLTGRYYAIGD